MSSAEGGRIFYRHLTRGTRVLLPWLSDREFLFTMFDLVCTAPPPEAPASFECRSHWHDETITFERVGARP